MIRVYVVVGSPVLRAGLESLLQPETDITVTDQEPDVVVTDRPEIPEVAAAAILLSDSPRLEDIHPPIRGVLPRDVAPAELIAATHAVAAGLVVLHPAALAMPASDFVDTGPLTSREMEILGMLAEGLPNKTIAWKLDISEHTVKFHVASILSKLGVSSRTEAVTVGLRRGLIFL